MKALKMIAAATMFAATGAVFAQPTEYVEFTDFVSTKSRAEVRAELADAKPTQLAGEYVEFLNVASTAPAKTLRAANDSLLSQTPEYVEFLNVASTRSRAEVRNEVLQAAKPARHAVGG